MERREIKKSYFWDNIRVIFLCLLIVLVFYGGREKGQNIAQTDVIQECNEFIYDNYVLSEFEVEHVLNLSELNLSELTGFKIKEKEK